ncbi:unnamed protein product [Didymodactylos carnosus]|uniref:Uncharacterized protein n=1 Tax=Didymodactylos carnosus TaxID=1234261 RepID=A0A815SLZ7_9BILA|nr:unnamed protein product [Didymodactylos carnosus]CAF1491819.1 unnamed protein product [Didymodactylos carnosus]CAF4153778.1 unnamed protein product [Didymodactylos carnosus]CAF4354801.1 unnamed protein product [Didymodactylos carnosus]
MHLPRACSASTEYMLYTVDVGSDESVGKLKAIRKKRNSYIAPRLATNQGVWGGIFHINQIVMIYDQKCTRIRGVDFSQATVLELDHQQQRCLVKFNYNQLSDYAGFYEVFQMPFQGLEDDDMDNDKLACLKRIQSMEINPSSIMNNNSLKALLEYLDYQQSEYGSELYHDIDTHELYVDPFDSRYNSSDEDEEEAEKTNSQPATPGTTLGTVRKHCFHDQHMRDFACYLQNTAYRFLENYTKRTQGNMEETSLKENGEIWYDHQIKQQRQQFIRTTPSHSHDNEKLKQIIAAAASEQHVITKLLINTNNPQKNQLEVEHELLKPPQQNRKQQRPSWLQQPTQKVVEQRSIKQPSFFVLQMAFLLIKLHRNLSSRGLARGPTQSIAGTYAHVSLILAVVRVGIIFRPDTKDGSTNIENTSGHWDWLWPYIVS